MNIYLNEDLFDEIDLGELPKRDISTELAVPEDSDSKEYKYNLTFFIGAMAKRRSLEWYTSKLRNFQEDLFSALDASKYIDEFCHNLPTFKVMYYKFCLGIREETIDSVRIAYPEDMKSAENALSGLNNDIKFTVGINADVEEAKKFLKFLNDVVKAFRSALFRNFRSGANPKFL
jgi:hypothetical protein